MDKYPKPKWEQIQSIAKGDGQTGYRLEIPNTGFIAYLYKYKRETRAPDEVIWKWFIACGGHVFHEGFFTYQGTRDHYVSINAQYMKRLVSYDFEHVFTDLARLAGNASRC